MKPSVFKFQSGIFVASVWLLLWLTQVNQARAALTNLLNRPILACGEGHGVMVKSDGTVWTWGDNQESELGGVIPPTTPGFIYENRVNLNPSRETNILGAVAVWAGDRHTFVLKWDGSVMAFGDNQNGDLGLGDTTDRDAATVVPGLNAVTAMAGGLNFSLAVLSNGIVKAWGNNDSGQLGIGNKVTEWVPFTVTGLSNIVAVACGYNHSLALSSNGTVWAFGANGQGQLGDNTTSDETSPILVPNLSGVIAIAAGCQFSMALKTNGTVYTWGNHDKGRLGVGNISNDQRVPTLVSALSNICLIAKGAAEGYAVDTSNRLWIWGNPEMGWNELGPGIFDPVWSPVYQTNLSDIIFVAGSGENNDAASSFLAAALDANGIIQNWGVINYGSSLNQVITGSVTTNIDWGYTDSFDEHAVETNAYYRGNGSQADFASFVIPLDFQEGTPLAYVGGVATNAFPFVLNYPTNYQYNLANSGLNGQTNLSLRIAYQNPIVAFGSRVGGPPLYTSRSYRFALFSGCPAMINDYPMLTNYDSALKIEVYSKSDYSLVGITNFSIPFYLCTNNNWSVFLTNGLTTTLNYFGLATTLSTLSYPNAYGVTNNGVLQLSQQASDMATNYIYVVKVKGMNGSGWMSLDQNLNPAWQPLYTLEFLPAPPWNIRYLSQLQFQGEPLPPFYDGMSLDELLTNSWAVANVINLPNPISSYTNLDDSPELRQHPILDNFVSQLKNDPIAIARFVQNEIELTDAIDYAKQGQITSGQVNLSGVNRSALGTFLERQGSPVEQCALLIYLLRKAGVPAVYALPPTNGVKMLDARLSKLLRVQLNGAIDPDTGLAHTNTLISVNYPWVAAFINNQWVHLFPWIKDTEIIQGPNLYDYMPANYNNATKWVMGYLYNNPNIVNLGDTNDPPEILFPRYVEQQLLTNAPGISFDELGIQAVNRRHAYSSWDEFPTPTWVANTNLVAESLSDSTVTNAAFAGWNPNIFSVSNIFNTTRVEVLHNGTNIIGMDTLALRCCDIHDRSFLIYYERTNPSTIIRLKMNLAAYRPSITNVSSFTDDPSLTNNEFETKIVNSDYNTDMSIRVTINRYLASGEIDPIKQTIPIGGGDLNALCLNFGRVSEEMLEPLAQNIWNVETQIKQTPSITNTLTTEQFQGPLIYLMGMSYYQKVDHFVPINARIHGRTTMANVGIGLAKLIAKTDGSSDGFPAGPMIYYQPSVDMHYTERIIAEAPTARADSGTELNYANDAFNILAIVDGSAKEHVVINSFFNQVDSVSTVKLLQLTAQRHKLNPLKWDDILVVNQNNVIAVQTNSYFPPSMSLGSMDPSVWGTVESTLFNSTANLALVTPGLITNNTGSYLGMGALIIDNQGTYSALISQAGNGGWGPYIPDYSFANANFNNVWLGTSGAGSYSFNFTAPSLSYQPLAFDNFAPAQTLDLSTAASSGFLDYTPFNMNWAQQASGYLAGSPSLNGAFASSLFNSQNGGFIGWLSDALQQLGSAVVDPVHVVSGEFFVDSVDLTLVGPLPLEIRRNYSSLNTANNEFGTGWKMSFMPFISVATNTPKMYAAEPDGSVLAYTPAITNANLWVPTLSQNPQLVNNRKEGIGSTANLLLTFIVQTNLSGTTNFYLYSPSGDVRNYQVRSFSISNVIDRTRPYLISWLDARGNSLNFSYGTNSQATDYGQLARVDSSSGAYIQFAYDIYGHILRAFANDGREVDYQYDGLGDLITVTLPDASEFNYQYSHGYQTVTNSYTANGKGVTSKTAQVYSLHLLTVKTDPDGRILQNTYDSQQRVISQASTVAADSRLVTNATFVYANNFVLTNSVTNTISGYTLLSDVFGNTTRYDYTNNRITLITDPLNQTIEQDWYDENPTLSGYYPRSLWKAKDKRGLWTTFKYDSFGNVTNTITSGNLTGEVGIQTATNVTYYNSNNLPSIVIDAIGNSNVFRYDPIYAFLPKELVAYRQGQAVTTNEVTYGSVTNVVQFGNTLWTNVSFGLPQFLIRGYGSVDAASNQWSFNGSGFVTNTVAFTSSSDPAITNILFYNGRGELNQLVDAAGRLYSYDYDGMGRITSEEAFDAGQTTPMSWQVYYYNHNGEITWYDGPQYNPEDYVWFDYDGAGRKDAEVHWRSQAVPDGSGVQAAPDNSLYSITSYEYDSFGNLIKQTDPVGNYSIMSYDTIGQLTRQVFYAANDTALATNLMSRAPGGEMAIFTNSLGGITQTLYTQTGKPYFRQSPDGSTNGWQYDLIGRVQKEFLPNGSYWLTTYNDAARTVGRQFFNSGGTMLAATTNVFDRRGNLITNITAQGGVFFNVYDGQNRLKVAGGPASAGSTSAQQIEYTFYDAAGASLTNMDSLGRKTVTTYDAIQRPISSQTYDSFNGNALVASQTINYSPDYHCVTVTNGTGGSAIARKSFVDSFNNPVITQVFPSSTPVYAITSFDLAERVASSQDELGRVTSYTYDGLNRLGSKQLPDGATTVNTYNGEGGLTGMVMPGGLTWSATYDSANRQTSEKLTSGASVSRQFTNIFSASGSTVGLLQSATDLGRSVTNTFSYDAFRRVSTASATSSQSWQALTTTYQYDRAGTVTNYTQTSPINPTTSVNRFVDGYGQMTNEQVSIGGTLQNSFIQNWDASGRRSLLQAPTAAFNYAYRVDGLMSGVIAFGYNYNFSYANNGLLTSRSNPWRTLGIDTFDGQGRALQQTTAVGGGNPLVENMTWRPDSTLNSYAATRTGTGAWNDSRTYQYNTRGQLTSEPIGVNSSTVATNAYSFDASLLGVLVGAQWSGGLTNKWLGSLDAFSRVTSESWSESSLTLRANGSAVNAGSVSASLDGSSVSSTLNNGRWYSDLTLSPGNHSLAASAYYPVGLFTMTVTNTFAVLGTNNVTDMYDASGNVTNRVFTSGKTQSLAWDAAGRLVSLTQWNNSTNGFFWTAIYDAMGRRLRTTYVPVVNGYTNTLGTLTLDSYYDPQVEFEEVGTAVNGQRTWKVLGPDLGGHYGSLQGVGGLEATVRESDGLTTPVLNDYFGNVLATVSGSTANWNSVRVGGYGPVLGYQSPTLTAGTPMADTLAWRSRGIDPSGFYNLGARYYDPVAGHFLSADPLGHAASMDLHSFCNGDPINRFDPTGRFGKGAVAGIADKFDFSGGPTYKSTMDTGTAAFQIGYDAGNVAAEALVQVGIIVATEGLGELAAGVAAEGRLGLEAGELGGMAGFAERSEGAAVALGETEAGLAGVRTEATFAASEQGEFAFAKELTAAEVEGASVAAKEAQVSAQTTAATSSGTASGASQASQSGLNLGGAQSTIAADTGTARFINQFPEHEIGTPIQTFSPSQVSGNFSRRLNYVVTQDGKLVLGRQAREVGGGHIDLAGGAPVQAAGEVKFVGGELRYIDNSSGHYLPSGPAARNAAVNAFEKAGLGGTGKYIEKIWNGSTWVPK